MPSNTTTNRQTKSFSTTDLRIHIGVGESRLLTLPPDASALEAVQLMRNNHVGDVLIAEDRDGEKYPVGIVTDRDLAIEILAQCVAPESLEVSAVMTRDLVTCSVGAGVFEMIRTMKENGVTRLPLVNDNGALKGIVNAKNLIQLLTVGLHELAHITEKQRDNEKDLRH